MVFSRKGFHVKICVLVLRLIYFRCAVLQQVVSEPKVSTSIRCPGDSPLRSRAASRSVFFVGSSTVVVMLIADQIRSRGRQILFSSAFAPPPAADQSAVSLQVAVSCTISYCRCSILLLVYFRSRDMRGRVSDPIDRFTTPGHDSCERSTTQIRSEKESESYTRLFFSYLSNCCMHVKGFWKESICCLLLCHVKHQGDEAAGLLLLDVKINSLISNPMSTPTSYQVLLNLSLFTHNLIL